MAAATSNVDTARFGEQAVVRALMSLPVAASTHIYQGTIVCLDLDGNLVAATADATLYVVGVAQEESDNSSGSAGALRCSVERGAFYFANGTSTAAIVAADVGRVVYAADDQTLSRLNTSGELPAVGKVISVDGSQVIVECGLLGRAEANGGASHDVLYPAGASLTTSDGLFVKLNGSSQVVLADSAGEQALGVLLNRPASGAIAIVRVLGLVEIIASATIADGNLIATTASTARAKPAVAATVNTSDAGSSSDAVIGSFVMGMALSDGTAGNAFRAILNHMGAIPTTAA